MLRLSWRMHEFFFITSKNCKKTHSKAKEEQGSDGTHSDFNYVMRYTIYFRNSVTFLTRIIFVALFQIHRFGQLVSYPQICRENRGLRL